MDLLPWATVDDDLSDFYEPGSINIEKYYEFRDNNLKNEEAASTISNTCFLDSSARLQLATIINKDKPIKVGSLVEPYSSLKSSNDAICEEISKMLQLEDSAVENLNFKLSLSKFPKPHKDDEDDRLRINGLNKSNYFLDDSFFTLKPKNGIRKKSSEVNDKKTPMNNSNECQDDADSSNTSSACSITASSASSIQKNLFIQDEDPNDIFLQRALSRYSEPTIGVPDERYIHPSKTTVSDYIEKALEKQKKSKKVKPSYIAGAITDDNCENTPEDQNHVHQKCFEENTPKKSPIMNNSENKEEHISETIELTKILIKTDNLHSQDVNAKLVTKSDRTKYYKPRNLYNLKKNVKS